MCAPYLKYWRQLETNNTTLHLPCDKAEYQERRSLRLLIMQEKRMLAPRTCQVGVSYYDAVINI